jgi:hypothetical protein
MGFEGEALHFDLIGVHGFGWQASCEYVAFLPWCVVVVVVVAVALVRVARTFSDQGALNYSNAARVNLQSPS